MTSLERLGFKMRAYLSGEETLVDLSNAAHSTLADTVNDPAADSSGVIALVHLIADLDAGVLSESEFRHELETLA